MGKVCSYTVAGWFKGGNSLETSKVLVVDALINLVLGALLITFRPEVVAILGVPSIEHTFYPTILGGILFGIGIALLIESFRRPSGMIGLGLGGAISINLCGGIVLGIWLIAGDLDIPLRGQVFLSCLVILLLGISVIELVVHLKRSRRPKVS